MLTAILWLLTGYSPMPKALPAVRVVHFVSSRYGIFLFVDDMCSALARCAETGNGPKTCYVPSGQYACAIPIRQAMFRVGDVIISEDAIISEQVNRP